MKTEIITIGNEILQGKIQDKNTQALARELHKIGLELNFAQIIGDTKEALEQAYTLAFSRSDYVFTSGGLGPTLDDQTKFYTADFFELEVLENESALERTLLNYEKHIRSYEKDKSHYHQIPKGFIATENPCGYAPGLIYPNNKKVLMMAPGVPSEFKAMVCEIFFPYLLKNNFTHQSDLTFKSFTIKTYRIGESKIFNSLCPSLWQELEKYGSVSSLPRCLGVDVCVYLKGSPTEIIKQEKEIISIVEGSKLKPYIYHYGQIELQELVVQKAIEKKISFGFAESCTGGLNSSRVTDISGSSAVFAGSIISYANSVKENQLGVKTKTLIDHGAVSKQCAVEMALGARKHLNVDIAISTTGIAGPNGGSKDKPVGTVSIGIASKSNESSESYFFRGDREGLKSSFSEMALLLLLQEIEEF